jgi:nucleotide-binding universal stress UspA family protein
MTAAALANEGAELTLLYVDEVAPYSPWARIVDNNDGDAESYDAQIREAMGDALAVISEHGATASTLVVRGTPVHATIKRVARKLSADVILIGAHGRRDASRTHWDSVTDDLIRETDVPIIAIRESWSQLSGRLVQ